MLGLDRIIMASIVALVFALSAPANAGADKLAAAPMVELPAEKVLATYGDWTVYESGEFVSATTSGKNDSVFGFLCARACSYYVGSAANCTPGAVAAGMFARADGNSTITFRCSHVKIAGEEFPLLMIDEDLTDWLDGIDRISISIPISRGRPEVLVFSMKGAAEAMDYMLTRVEELHPESPDNSPTT